MALLVLSSFTVGVGGRAVPLHIHGITVRAPLKDADAHSYLRISDQTVAGIPHYRLVSELIRCLREEGGGAEQDNDKSQDFLHIVTFGEYIRHY